MNFLESVRLAMESIKANKLRSVLTMLGIIIGISSVITITTIGNSLQKTLASTMNSLGGTNMITASVEPYYPSEGESWDTWVYPDQDEEDMLYYDDLLNFQNEFSDKVNSVIAELSLNAGTVTGDSNTANVQVSGVTPGYIDANKVTMLEGRDITEEDNKQYKATAVVSDLFVKYACDGKSPIGKQIEIALDDGSFIKVYVVGVYKYDKAKMSAPGDKTPEKDIASTVLIPFTFASGISTNENPDAISYFTVIAKDGVDTVQFGEDISNYFDNTIFLNNADWHVTCQDISSQMAQINTVLNVITIAISVIAAISLIVGGVGVMNIMLVSVVERTKEIGVRKALGAKNRAIQMQFLTESVVICLIGGIIGILLGILNGFLLSQIAVVLVANYATTIGSLLTVEVSPSTTAILVSVIFSMLIGVIFGSYPAKRAAKMSPIDALRYE